jgi:hypothetical protein
MVGGRRALVVAVGATLCGCSLLISTSGLSGDAVSGGDGSAATDAETGSAADGADAPSTTDASVLVDAASSAYAAAVIADTPIAYLRLDEPSGTTAKNAIAGGPSGIYVGTVVHRTPGAVGDGNHATDFDGTSAWIDLGDQFAFAGTAAYSLEIWMRPASVDNTRFLFDRGLRTGASGATYTLYFGTGYLLTARGTLDGGEFGYASSSITPPLNAWTYVVSTYDGAQTRLFVNGEQVDEKVAGAIENTPGGRLSVGDKSRGQFNKYAGSLDEVAVYDKALPAARIKAHFVASGR